MRAISTVLDVAVFLLLVSASVGALTLAPQHQPDRVTVDTTATTLATTTADVTYTLQGEQRHAHGTIGTLLARAAVERAVISGHPLSSSSQFVDRVRAVTRARISSPTRTQVIAHWVPYRGAPIRGRVTVGSAPPAGADVTVATLSIPAPFTPVPLAPPSDVNDTFHRLARVTASAIADQLLPKTRLEVSASSESPTAAITAHRFHVFASALDLELGAALQQGDIALARSLVTDALAETFAREMRSRFESPTAGRGAVRITTVDLVVRRWDE